MCWPFRRWRVHEACDDTPLMDLSMRSSDASPKKMGRQQLLDPSVEAVPFVTPKGSRQTLHALKTDEAYSECAACPWLTAHA